MKEEKMIKESFSVFMKQTFADVANTEGLFYVRPSQMIPEFEVVSVTLVAICTLNKFTVLQHMALHRSNRMKVFPTYVACYFSHITHLNVFV